MYAGTAETYAFIHKNGVNKKQNKTEHSVKETLNRLKKERFQQTLYPIRKAEILLANSLEQKMKGLLGQQHLFPHEFRARN